jgi:hypothetical protein
VLHSTCLCRRTTLLDSRTQVERRASGINRIVPSSERTHRTSVLVTTQMKVSSGVSFHRRIEKQRERLVGGKLS